MPVSFAYTREIVEESELNVYRKAYFCRVSSVLQMVLYIKGVLRKNHLDELAVILCNRSVCEGVALVH